MLDMITAPEMVTRAKAAAQVIGAQGLTKSYDGKTMILKGIDLQIEEGEQVALIGSNGSGKSTLLRCLIGLHDISGGSLSCFGTRRPFRSTRTAQSSIRQQTGFVFQKHCLVRRRSVLSNVVHGLYGASGSWRAFSHSIAPEQWRRRAMEALDEVGLADHALHRADALSGGQQQRVAVARALIRHPRLLIADEPAASLDPVSGRNVMELFQTLCTSHGITLIYTSHDMTHAMDYATRVVALKQGRVLFDKPSKAVTAAELKETFND